jgi:alpha-tubulin suppressor-like RCC1 family protein
LFVLGANKNGKSGIGNSRKNIETPTRIEGVSNVEQISCGRDFCLTVSSDGSINSWGANNFGQLGGYEHYSSTSPHPVRFLKDKAIVKVLFRLFG